MNAIRLCLLVFASILLGAGLASSQEIVKIDPRSFCAARPGSVPVEVATFEPTRAAEEAFESILDRYALSSREWQLKQTTALTGTHVDPISRNPTIFYDDDFVRELQTGDAWAARGALAHEIGHHLNFHFQNDASRQDEELEADNFAGSALFRMGASEDEAAQVFRELGGGEGYPAVEDRVTSARNGWRRACDNDPVCSIEQMKEGEEEDDKDLPTLPEVSRFGLEIQHSPFVVHRSGRMNGGPGLRLRLRGQLRYSRRAEVRARIQFAFPDGRWLFAHDSEPHYRAANNLVATGVFRVPFSGGELNLSRLEVHAIPYYVLNLGVPGPYRLMAQAFFFVDGVEVARSDPTPFFVNRW